MVRSFGCDCVLCMLNGRVELVLHISPEEIWSIR